MPLRLYALIGTYAVLQPRPYNKARNHGRLISSEVKDYLRLPYFHSPALPHFVAESVWALPISLAATQGISLDFSSSPY